MSETSGRHAADEAAGEGSVAATPSPASRVRRWLDNRFRSPSAIYGLLVFAAFVTITSDDADDAWDILGSSVTTLLVFFAAHVFAHTLTDHGDRGLLGSTRHALVHSAGMLYAAIPSVIVLVIGGIRDVPPDDIWVYTVDAALVVLAILGFAAYSRRGSHIAIRLLGAVGTAFLGFVIIMLEYAAH